MKWKVQGENFMKSDIIIYEYLIYLLKCFCHQRVPEKREEIDWEKMLQLAMQHSVQGILSYMIISYKLSCDTGLLEAMRQMCMQTMLLYARKDQAMKILIGQMNQAEIEHILFKGYVLKDDYPVPELRSYGDIDIVIHLKDREKSHQLMLDLGYQVKNDWEAVYSYLKDYEYYEIHTDIMEINISKKADYQEYFRKMWDHTVTAGEFSRRFTPEYHFIYLLNHIAKHIYGSGAGIRMYLDLAIYVRAYKDQMDWKFIETQLKKLELYDFYCTVMWALKNWFDVEGKIKLKMISDTVGTDFMIFTMEGGTFGYSNRQKGVNVLKKTASNETKRSRFMVIVKRMFPGKESLEKRYTYLKKYPWLLPYAWIHRFFKTKKTWTMHFQEAESIMSASKEDVEQMRELHKNIGL